MQKHHLADRLRISVLTKGFAQEAGKGDPSGRGQGHYDESGRRMGSQVGLAAILLSLALFFRVYTGSVQVPQHAFELASSA